MDPLVSFNQSELLHTALQKSKVETTLITIEGGGHGQGFGSKATELVERFFDHHFACNVFLARRDVASRVQTTSLIFGNGYD